MRYYRKENGYLHMYDVKMYETLPKGRKEPKCLKTFSHDTVYEFPKMITYYTLCLYNNTAFYENLRKNIYKLKERHD